MKEEMKLFEVTNGFTGCSYVRVYVWAFDNFQAIDMAKLELKAGAFVAKCLFSASDVPFCTKSSDEGWA